MNYKSDSLTTELLIYIPTYNRSSSLLRLLAILIPQISSDKKAIIYISDNCSAEDYSTVINLTKKYSFILYNKNFANIGGNANIANAFCCSVTSKFLWILSDSEIPTDTCLSELESYFYSKSELCLFSKTKETKEYIQSYDSDYNFLFRNGVGQISNLIFNRYYFSTHVEAAYFYHNSSFPHLAVLFSLIKKNKQCNIYLINVDKLFKSIPRSSDTDYRLARIGMPLIAELFSDNYAQKFTNSWLVNRWYFFFKNKDFLPHVFFATKTILLKSNKPYSFIKFTLFEFAFILINTLNISEDTLRKFGPKGKQ